jgi:small subunit ribosomal protein S1
MSKENLEEKKMSAAENEQHLEEQKQDELEQYRMEKKAEEEAEKQHEEGDFDIDLKEDHQEEIDWERLNNKNDEYTPDERADLSKLYDETLSTVVEGEVVKGKVISLNKREVVININYKSEGVVSRNEFRYNPDLKEGDEVDVYVETQEDAKGQLIISHKKARLLTAWDRVNKSYTDGEIITGYIKARTKGGMIVDVFGIEAFLPGSQIDVNPIRDYDAFVDKTMEFKVVKINPEFKNVVVSHKALIEAELEEQKKQIIANLEKGQVLEGIVKNITSYGVFVDLGGVDGLIHITDLSWGRINHPEEVVKLDEKIQVVILDFNNEKKRIALGMKQLQPHPWESLDPNLKVGDKVKGKVVVLADYGAFIEIAPGVEGLIHVSEMSWSQHLRTAQEFLKIGDEVEVVILTLDREERKMSLGMKQLKPDMWETIEEKYPVGSKHKGIVRHFTNFGIFVELEEGIDGLVHVSDLSWTKKIKHPAEFVKPEAELEVVVLDIDKENRRLSLGHKQLEDNPWDAFETVFEKGSIHDGVIAKLSDKGAVVTLPYGLEGFASQKHLKKEDKSRVKVDEKLPFRILEFNKDAKKIIVSHTQTWEEPKEQPAEKKAASSVKPQKMEKTTLGDVSGALEELKQQMMEDDKKKKDK